ncbi:MAG: circularly permuted type 2 ATP-grasp protein, partial [Bryobacteraceae bacterium]|nr:circularly permuted type 2 ATP-grasp protein [Bryobacteraceae bacterium]
MRFAGYEARTFFDEMFEADGTPREEARLLVETIESLPKGDLLSRQQAAERLLLQMGITFNVYGDSGGTERIFPFDVIPRIVSAKDWAWLERGLKQRIHALNLFIDDVYHEQKILTDGVVPRDIISSAKCLRAQCVGINPPRSIWCHITGTDLVRDSSGQIYVLEDNLRV